MKLMFDLEKKGQSACISSLSGESKSIFFNSMRSYFFFFPFLLFFYSPSSNSAKQSNARHFAFFHSSQENYSINTQRWKLGTHRNLERSKNLKNKMYPLDLRIHQENVEQVSFLWASLILFLLP